MHGLIPWVKTVTLLLCLQGRHFLQKNMHIQQSNNQPISHFLSIVINCGMNDYFIYFEFMFCFSCESLSFFGQAKVYLENVPKIGNIFQFINF